MASSQTGQVDSSVNVEKEEDVHRISSPFLLDHISMVFALIFFGCLIAFLLFRTNSYTRRSSFYPCNKDVHYYSLHLDLNIDSFSELHKSVKIWVSGFLNSSAVISNKPLNFSVDTTGYKEKVTVHFYRQAIQKTDFIYPANSRESEQVFINEVFLNSSFDQIKVHLVLNSDFENYEGINVHWSFNTAPKPTYVSFLQILLPSTTLYLVIHFLFHMTTMTEKFTQINVAILGCIAVIASVPYNLIFGQTAMGKITQFVMTAIMVSYFRYIVASQIELEAEGAQTPNMKVNIPLIIFFSFYALVDITITFSDGSSKANLPLMINSMNIMYIVISVILSAIAVFKSETGVTRRLIFMFVLEGLSAFIALRDQTYEDIVSSINLPIERILSFGASHIFMVSYMLILLQICSDIGYSEINAHNNDQSSLLKDKVGNNLLEGEIVNSDPEMQLSDE